MGSWTVSLDTQLFVWGGYKFRFDPKVGDMVVHCLNGVVCGVSKVATQCRETKFAPPKPGRWSGMSPYLRIDLTEYKNLKSPFKLKDFIFDLLPNRFGLLLERVGLLQSMIPIGLLDLRFGLATLCERSSLHVGRLRFLLLVDLR
jgi:hypothetical protein